MPNFKKYNSSDGDLKKHISNLLQSNKEYSLNNYYKMDLLWKDFRFLCLLQTNIKK